MSRLDELAEARLLDWRFLLPRPLAGRWAVAGGAPPGLAPALGSVPGCVVVPVEAGGLDGLVARDVRPHELVLLAGALASGGLLYLEVDHRTGTGSHRSHRRAVARAGVDVLGEHWHAPDFEHRTRIVPLGGRAGLRDTLARHEGRRAGALVAAVGRAAGRLGALDLAVPCTSVVGERR